MTKSTDKGIGAKKKQNLFVPQSSPSCQISWPSLNLLSYQTLCDTEYKRVCFTWTLLYLILLFFSCLSTPSESPWLVCTSLLLGAKVWISVLFVPLYSLTRYFHSVLWFEISNIEFPSLIQICPNFSLESQIYMFCLVM